MNKAEARKSYLRIREQYSFSSDSEVSRQGLCRQLLPLLKNHKGVWAAYQALPVEADPSAAVEQAEWLDWVYPRVVGDDLEFYRANTKDDFCENRWKIKEPIPQKSQKVKVDEISGFLVPGVAFDRKGRRIGQGKGFYDRLLTNHSACKVGVAFAVQVSETDLPVENHDVIMDFVVTEDALLKTS